ncbi:class I mannose-6-phosphate isomerase [Paenibacillus aceris]|uniref:Mannose-6-phosphate isomerase class I n=1 Tax=Paenibacillus aceris TaxID=869555 RepID=A0ABS4I360_9BACL|nr:class I mannose-6-phosphate isomerase [Paenibacillus aceris]MBP1965339.1 mannose-6-phosphate isomerase class I [Paenibacillus aceris]NHW36019.1 mannose-6-phosphate isomerase [Paenibacillus aceris]
MKSSYNKEPSTLIRKWEHEAWSGYEAIGDTIGASIANKRKEKAIVVVECYPGVRQKEILEGLTVSLKPVLIVRSEEAALDPAEVDCKVERYMSDDRVFGYMAPFNIDEFYEPDKVDELRSKISAMDKGIIVVIGFGASLIARGDVLIYADLARWEIQLRYRSKEIGNWRTNNREDDTLRLYKRGFFFEWRMADRLKRSLFDRIDFYLDSNAKDEPKMLSRQALFAGLSQTASQPFRLVPYFDPGVWGGTWLETNIDLPKRNHPYAWGFDGVPEENSLYFQYGSLRLEIPAINLVFFESIKLLGERVYSRFGAEFPIRFDFLDTIGGQNLSLQVHPTTDYIREQFGMPYTQDESYYILDAAPGAEVYLGLKEDIDPDAMITDLHKAQNGEWTFPAKEYVNVYPAAKHDHFLIPAGTVHCSGTGCMVLEISATPYIFTFKLWDWDRLGLDGRPRPVHVEHGAKVIQWNRTTEWTTSECVGRIEKVAEGEGWIEERTGLHELEFIETRRHWFSVPVIHESNGSVHMLNLIEGEEATVESPDGSFEPFVVRYAETFIVPASVPTYLIRPSGKSEGKTIGTIKAYVRA